MPMRMCVSPVDDRFSSTAGAASGRRAGVRAATACTTSTSQCTEWVTLGAGPSRSMIYTSHSLDSRNDRIRRALIMVHGTNRNADHYFATADRRGVSGRCARRHRGDRAALDCVRRQAGRQRGRVELWRRQLAVRRRVDEPPRSDSRLISPIKSCASWQTRTSFPTCRRSSSPATPPAGSSSRATRCPTAFTRRSACRSHTSSPIRPVTRGRPPHVQPCRRDAEPADAKDGWKSESVHTNFTFAAIRRRASARPITAGRSVWRIAASGYTAKTPDAQLKKQLVSRPTTYLLGQVDTLAARWLRLVVRRDGAGTDATGTRRGVRQVRRRHARRQTQSDHRARVWTQRSLRVYDESVLPVIFPK